MMLSRFSSASLSAFEGTINPFSFLILIYRKYLHSKASMVSVKYQRSFNPSLMIEAILHTHEECCRILHLQLRMTYKQHSKIRLCIGRAYIPILKTLHNWMYVRDHKSETLRWVQPPNYSVFKVLKSNFIEAQMHNPVCAYDEYGPCRVRNLN